MGGSIRGVTATVRWVYFEAARLEGYTITREGTQWRVSGRVVWTHSQHLKQSPLTFVAPHAGGEWAWVILDYDITAGRLSAHLGPPVEG
jgi:hypothetical protein